MGGRRDQQNASYLDRTQPRLSPGRQVEYPVINSVLMPAHTVPYISTSQTYRQTPFRPPHQHPAWAEPLQPPVVPRVKADRHAEWRQRIPHGKRHGGPSVEGSQEAQITSSQSQRAAGECKIGIENDVCVAQDFGSTRSVEAIQSAGDDSGENANDKASGTETWETPSEALYPSNLGLAGSLNYVANKYFGVDVLNQSSETAQFTGFLLDTIERLETQLSYLRAGDDLASMSEGEDEVEKEKAGEVLPYSQTLHQILCTNPWHKHHNAIFEDEPSYGFNRASDGDDLTGKVPIYNLNAYLAQHSSICFIIFKEHNCATVRNKSSLDWDLGNPECTASERLEKLQIVSPMLQKALETVAQFRLKKKTRPPE